MFISLEECWFWEELVVDKSLFQHSLLVFVVLISMLWSAFWSVFSARLREDDHSILKCISQCFSEPTLRKRDLHMVLPQTPPDYNPTVQSFKSYLMTYMSNCILWLIFYTPFSDVHPSLMSKVLYKCMYCICWDVERWAIPTALFHVLHLFGTLGLVHVSFHPTIQTVLRGISIPTFSSPSSFHIEEFFF